MMDTNMEFDALSDEEKFKALRKALWALRADVVSLGGVEGKLKKEIEALKARLAKVEK